MYLVFNLISINLLILIINRTSAFTFTNSFRSKPSTSNSQSINQNFLPDSSSNLNAQIDREDDTQLNNRFKWPNIRFMNTFLRSTPPQQAVPAGPGINYQNLHYQNHPHAVNNKHLLLSFNPSNLNEQTKQPLPKIANLPNDQTRLENENLGLIDWNKISAKLNKATGFKADLMNDTNRATKHPQDGYSKSNLSAKKEEEEKETNNGLLNYFTTFFSSNQNDNDTVNLDKEKQLTKTKQFTSPSVNTKLKQAKPLNEPTVAVELFYFNDNLLAKKQIEVLVCDKTMAIINARKSRFKTNRTVQNCVLFDLEKRGKEAEDVVKKLKINKLDIDFPTMMDIIHQCKRFSEPAYRIESTIEYESVKPIKSIQPANTFKVNNLTLSSNLNMQTDNKSSINLITGIVSGTLWCGLGDLAKNYTDLGPRKDLDICCRAHDHCPIRLKALRYGYGLLNFGISTKSHCNCDRDFFNCLKNVNSKLSNTIGNVYFNVLKLQCIEEGPTCIEENTKKECVKKKNMMQFKTADTY